MLQLRNACGADDLMGLWKLCFPDRVAWAEVFMRDIFSPEHTLVAVEDGVLAGSVYNTSASFEFRGMDVPVTYLLGLGVHPDFRGRGIATEMIRRLCADRAEKNIPFLFLLATWLQDSQLPNPQKVQGLHIHGLHSLTDLFFDFPD